MLVILNLPLIGIWIKLLTVPYKWLFPAIVLFCAVGVYSANNNNFDIWMVALFGLIGYAFIKLGCEPAPLLLGLILGPMMEEYLRRALLISRGDWSVFVTRPLSASLLLVATILLVVVLLPSVKKKRAEAFVEDCVPRSMEEAPVRMAGAFSMVMQDTHRRIYILRCILCIYS
jgi:TctA family transporter